MEQFPNWWPLVSMGINITILVFVIKLTWMFAVTQHKVDMMWAVFHRRYGTRNERGEDLGE